jgi:succinate-acetate transporter protein
VAVDVLSLAWPLAMAAVWPVMLRSRWRSLAGPALFAQLVGSAGILAVGAARLSAPPLYAAGISLILAWMALIDLTRRLDGPERPDDDDRGGGWHGPPGPAGHDGGDAHEPDWWPEFELAFEAYVTASVGQPSLAIAYGGLAQLLAGLWEFRTGNTFGAVAFCSFGAFWISYFFLIRLTPAVLLTPHAVSAYLWMWAIFTTYMFFASLRTTGAVALVFFLLAVTFVLLAIGDMGNGNTSIHHAGGWVGLATAIAAWYASFAAVMNSTWGRVVLPVYPLSRP